MPKIVEVDGIGNVEFPDDMSDADISKAIRSTLAKNQMHSAVEQVFGKNPGIDNIQNAWEHLKNFASSTWDAATRPPTDQETKDIGSTGAVNPVTTAIYRLSAEPTVNALRQLHEQWKKNNFTGGGREYDERGNYTPSVLSSAVDAIPVVGPWARNIETDAHQKGALPALTGGLTDVFAPEIASEIPRVPGIVKNAALETIAPAARLERPIHEDPAGLTPRERWEAARNMRVNMDAAQATNSPIPGSVKAVNRHSLAGEPSYADNESANRDALQWYTGHLLDGMAPAMGREEFGQAAREALLRHQQDLSDRSGNLYEALDERLGDKMPDTGDIRETAQKILDNNESFYQKHPELLKQVQGAWSVLQDLAGVKTPKPKTIQTPLLDAQGSPITSEVAVKGKAPDSWTDLHTLRSHLLDLYRSPEIVGSRSEGWLKQMVGKIDDAMTSAENTPGMTEEDQNAFRAANSLYERMKTMYDNPTSPFYSIVRTPEGLTAQQTLSAMKPQAVRNFREAMGDVGRSDLANQQTRQVAEQLINPAGNDDAGLRNFPSRFERTKKENLGGSLTPSQVSDLGNLASVAKDVFAKDNASGSGVLAQKAAEGGAIGTGLYEGAKLAATGHPVSGAVAAAAPVVYQGVQRGVASVLHSPKVVDALMAPREAVPSAPTSPAAVGQEIAAQQDKSDQDYPEVGVGASSSQANQGAPPPDKPGMTPLPPPGPQSSVTPDTHVFSRSRWKDLNPQGDEDEAARQAQDAGYEVYA